LAYIAEKKKPKSKPFYTSSVKPTTDDKESVSKDPNEGRVKDSFSFDHFA